MSDANTTQEPNTQTTTTTEPKIELTVADYNRLRAKDGELQALSAQVQELRAKLDEASKAPPQKPTKEANREQIEAEIRQSFAERLEEAEKAAQEYQGKYKGAVVTDRVLRTLENEKLFSWAANYVKPIIEKECDLDGDEIIIKDENGSARWSEKHPNKKMDISEYVESLKARQPEFFDANARSNPIETQGNKSNTNKFTVDVNKFLSMSQSELVQFAKKDPKGYDDLMKQISLGR